MTDAICAHPGCECRVPTGGPFGKYCSEHCKEARAITELRCQCQHSECRAGGRPDARPDVDERVKPTSR